MLGTRLGWMLEQYQFWVGLAFFVILSFFKLEFYQGVVVVIVWIICFYLVGHWLVGDKKKK